MASSFFMIRIGYLLFYREILSCQRLYPVKYLYGFEWKLLSKLLPKCSQKWQILHASTMAFDLGSKIIFALSVLERTGVISERNTESSQDWSEMNLCQSHSVSKK